LAESGENIHLYAAASVAWLTISSPFRKSQIAIEFAYRVMELEPNTSVFWVYASNVARFLESFQEIGVKAGLLERKDAEADMARLICDWLGSDKCGTWLLIVDNVDDADVLTSPVGVEEAAAGSVRRGQQRSLLSCIPQSKHGSVLVTSRFRKAAHSVVGDDTSLLHVGSLTETDAVLLLRAKLDLNDGDRAQATEFVRTLELIPLAITQAAAYIHERAPRMTLSRYMLEFARSESNKLTLLDQSAADLRRHPDVPSAVVTTWAISFEQIIEHYPSAANLLSLMSVLDNESIPEFLLQPEEDDERLAFEDDLAHLLGFSMIALVSQHDAVRMHPLVQLAMRKWLERNCQLSHWRCKAVRVLSERYPNPYDFKNLTVCKLLLPHAEATVTSVFEDDESQLLRATVLGRMVEYMVTAGYSGASARERAEEALRIRSCLLEVNHPDTLTSVSDLAAVLRDQGQYEAAEAMNRRALEGREEALGANHPETLTSVSNLASVLRDQGQYEAAEAMNRRALEGREEALGADHPDTLTSVSNLAAVLRNQGQYEAAEAMNRRALEGREEALGADHPETLTSVSELAAVLQYQGQYEAAEAMYRRALEGYEKVLGADHPHTLTSVSNLAAVLQDQGQYEAAEAMNRRALEGYEKVLGADHPYTLTSVSNLALVLQYQGQYDAAEAMNRRALGGREEALGADHRDTLTSVSSLASVLRYQGKYEAAEALNLRALEGYEKVLGADHPDTLTSVSNLALVLQDQGQYEAAEAMNRRALEGYEKALGADHPHTLTSVSNLATVLQDQGDYEAAEAMSRRALEGREKVLGLQHPHVMESREQLAQVLRYQGKVHEAEALDRAVAQ
jgi:tetratricopeptide (TPR) repeat protein